jgi:hypothetical protein
MMNKQQAKRAVRNYTWEELGEVLRQAQTYSLAGSSKVNPSLSRQEAWNIFSRAIAGKPPNAKPSGTVQEMIATNILREFA